MWTMLELEKIRLPGQGALTNRSGRFEPFVRLAESQQPDETRATRQIETVLENVRSIITRNQSPDLPFDRSINPYRGCEHGCIYCYARPTHAYMGLSAGIDFERRIFIKQNATRILQKELQHKRYRAEPIVLGANTDPYQPVERFANKTRRILEILLEHRHPVIIITKSNLILRDLDLIHELNRLQLLQINISIASLNTRLCARLEPRASAPARRLETLKELKYSGLAPGVFIAPVIPGLTDAELEPVLRASRKAGAIYANYILLRLPGEVKDLFVEWIRHHYPERADRVLHLIRQTRRGPLYTAEFHERMRGNGPFAELLDNRFKLATRRLQYRASRPVLRTDLFRPSKNGLNQMQLFE